MLQAEHFWGLLHALSVSLPKKCNNPTEMSRVSHCYFEIDIKGTVGEHGKRIDKGDLPHFAKFP